MYFPSWPIINEVIHFPEPFPPTRELPAYGRRLPDGDESTRAIKTLSKHDWGSDVTPFLSAMRSVSETAGFERSPHRALGPGTPQSRMSGWRGLFCSFDRGGEIRTLQKNISNIAVWKQGKQKNAHQVVPQHKTVCHVQGWKNGIYWDGGDSLRQASHAWGKGELQLFVDLNAF